MLGIALQQTTLRHSAAARRIAAGIVVAVIAACAIAVVKAAPVEPVAPSAAVSTPAPVVPVPVILITSALRDDDDPNDTSYLYYYAGMCAVLTRWSYWWYFWDCLNREGIPPSALVFEDVLYDAQPDGALAILVRREFSDGRIVEFTRHLPARRGYGSR